MKIPRWSSCRIEDHELIHSARACSTYFPQALNHLLRERMLAAMIAIITSATAPMPIHIHSKEGDSVEALADGLGLDVAIGETEDEDRL